MDTPKSNGNLNNAQPAIELDGTVKDSVCSPPFGLFEIGESKKAYIFTVVLPGAVKNKNNFKCNISRNGRVTISGEVAGSTVEPSRMVVQQLCPPGPFTVAFDLPTPVDPRLVSVSYRSGLLEVEVAKYQRPIMPMPVGVVFPNN